MYVLIPSYTCKIPVESAVHLENTPLFPMIRRLQAFFSITEKIVRHLNLLLYAKYKLNVI